MIESGIIGLENDFPCWITIHFRFYVISQIERNKKKSKEKEIYMFPSIFTVQILIASINKKVNKKIC